MKTMQQLPEGYRAIFTIDLERDKKSALYVNAFAVLITAMMILVMNFVMPISSLFAENVGAGGLILRILILAALLLLYIVLHEITHGITMKAFGCKQISYGFSGIYAFARCQEFFQKGAYFAVALAPVFVWGIVLTVICWLVPPSWFWVFYILQIANIAGAAGDYYVSLHFFFLPDDVLIYDSGTAMTVYAKNA